MEFRLSNYKSFRKYHDKSDNAYEKEIKLSDIQLNKGRNINIKNVETNIIENINLYLNNYKPSSPSTIPIIFDNFSLLHSFLGKNNSTESSAGYDYNKKKIYLKKEFYEGYSLHNRLREKGLSQSEITNFVILHEIGHAIHHQQCISTGRFINLQTKEASFLNNFMSFKDNWDKNPLSILIHSAFNSISEGFADLYSSIMIDKIYPEQQSEKIIRSLSETRLERYNRNTSDKEFYFTFNSLESYRLNKNTTSLNNFSDIQDYIFNTTIKETFRILSDETKLENIDSTYEKTRGLRYMGGILSEAYNLNTDNVQDTYKFMRSKYCFENAFTTNIDLILDKSFLRTNPHLLEEQNSFNRGKWDYYTNKISNNKKNAWERLSEKLNIKINKDETNNRNIPKPK